MTKYELYIIDDVFANYYYGRERMFFNLFKEYDEAKAKLKEIIDLQVQYITKPIPSLRIHKLLMQNLQTRKDFYIHQGAYYIENKTGFARLEINERKMTVESNGNTDTLLTFLEVLRKAEYNLFAFDLNYEQYGWIRPFKGRAFVQKEASNRHS